MGRCSLLVGLRFSFQSLDQMALMFREFWRIPGRFRGGEEFDEICIKEVVCRQVVGRVIDVD